MFCERIHTTKQKVNNSNMYTLKKDDRLGGPLTDKDRITMPCFASDYNYIHFLAYVLYAPLYLCGPILTFNDFISQVISE